MSSVEIPSEVEERIQRRVEQTEFDSVDEYVSFVLVNLLDEIEDAPADEELEERLKSLGYL